MQAWLLMWRIEAKHNEQLLPASLEAIAEASTVPSEIENFSGLSTVEGVKELKAKLQEKVCSDTSETLIAVTHQY